MKKLGLAYTIAIVPAVILAAVDRKFRSLEGMTIAGVLLAFWLRSVSVFFVLGFHGTVNVAALGGVPAVVCSLLSKVMSA